MLFAEVFCFLPFCSRWEHWSADCAQDKVVSESPRVLQVLLTFTKLHSCCNSLLITCPDTNETHQWLYGPLKPRCRAVCTCLWFTDQCLLFSISKIQKKVTCARFQWLSLLWSPKTYRLLVGFHYGSHFWLCRQRASCVCQECNETITQAAEELL